ncbi:prion-inhibition and propagation-domain-containing protein [Microdochium trichocladiopsis]|uniref:Prion-inhibition and propagation-domain-containing protein n=1 Tax=Microdochium trichocladiopsis TaxID=1682393 RepID=A0A9P8Y3N4_9PEZI|nr:prion-inhibition and propagation-domain-containing protein [Microdochium trichocladiopsis]KAH7027327.1 prion-inhibition and propagation-domain-containing protein [Microdochium trichocladiopsis]
MVEVFGTVAGAMSVAALFNNAVDTLGYIKLGRHFARDFERCQLKLDIARTRLARWGNAVDITGTPRYNLVMPQDDESQRVCTILEAIMLLFQDAQKVSERYALSKLTDGSNLEYCDPATSLTETGRRTHERLLARIATLQKGTSFAKKAAWALYDAKDFDRLIVEIAELIGSLEKLTMTQPVPRRLVEIEIEEMDDDVPSLMLLQDASSGVDAVLQEVVTDRVSALSSRNHIGTLKAIDRARAKAGDHWAIEAMVKANSGFRTAPSDNKVDNADMAGDSRLHVGNSYGGGSLWD